jgi:hypothetical protein
VIIEITFHVNKAEVKQSRPDDLKEIAELVGVEGASPKLEILQFRERVEIKESARATLEHEQHFANFCSKLSRNFLS